MTQETARLTLAQVADRLRDGRLSVTECEEYCMAWNNTPGRFTVAKVIGYNIIQKDKG